MPGDAGWGCKDTGGGYMTENKWTSYWKQIAGIALGLRLV